MFPVKGGQDARFEIRQTRADKAVLEYIKSVLGFGRVKTPEHRPRSSVIEVTWDEYQGVRKGIFEGRMSVRNAKARN